VRSLSHRLHPENLRLIGLVAALSGLQRELSTADVSVNFSHDNVPPSLPSPLMVSLFRITQEAARNAIAHSHAREVAIRLSGSEEGLLLTIADNGIGFDVHAARTGIGLVSMTERAEQIGATLRIDSKPGGGTRLDVTVPLLAESLKMNSAV
jgi:signal transduction histidine kinase